MPARSRPRRLSSTPVVLALLGLCGAACASIPQPGGGGGGGDDDDDDGTSDDDGTGDDDTTAGDDDATPDDDDATSGDDDDATADDDDATSDDDTSGSGAPVILVFDSDLDAITQGGMVVFTAVVTDPDGIDDLIGGTLESPTGATYGAFVTFADEGTYEIDVTWTQMAAIEEIEFTTSDTRDFVARFFDAAGHDTAETLTLSLHCGGGPACDSVCADTDNDPDNCGGCGIHCSGCRDGTCYDYECVPSGAAIHNCEDACAIRGLTCAVGECESYLDGMYFDGPTCDPEASHSSVGSCEEEVKPYPGYGVYCCCGDG